MDPSLNSSNDSEFQTCINIVLQSGLSETQKKTFLTTLKKILVNVTTYSLNTKYQSINTESETFISKIRLNGALDDLLIDRIFSACYFIKNESFCDSQKGTSSQLILQSSQNFILSPNVCFDRLYSLQAILQKALDEALKNKETKQLCMNVSTHREKLISSKIADSLVLESIREDQKEKLPKKDNFSRFHTEPRKSFICQNPDSNKNTFCRSVFHRIMKFFCFKRKT
ncbi:uncharacterized protein LOC128884198 isoform X2 [Hylaeus volcanicus]|uniref:uncharacterized protein LOC128884198 isoform X2 n=1 Tax=Hylaeus volcanicus TaxID=313075 RepID=UPI0023B837D2|nr:uncharacterized protein LOC128884198 isoform X2 [Hylaeus volcanicus]